MGNAGKREWGSVRRFLVFLLALLMAPAERSGTVYGAKKLTPHSLRACEEDPLLGILNKELIEVSDKMVNDYMLRIIFIPR